MITLKTGKNNSNIARFKTAFNSFFNDIKFKGLDDSKKSEINCLFEKNSKTFTIDNLSSGEKQIVFRGTYLLKNINHMDNCVVLIDEPELSMHPKWQQKILKYYRDLYSNTNNEIQMIFATHSDEVVKSAYDNNNSLVIILKKDKDGNLSVINTSESKFVLPRLSSAEINYRTFGTFAVEYHILLYGYLQCLKKLDRIKECDDFIYKKIIDKKNNYDDINEYIIIDEYDKSKTEYKTLPTYIRNSINHPNDKRKFTAEMLDNSIKLLINLIKNCK
ncbi:MAG: AAA family ATPase [Bdellovibrionota bacterium]|nr:AAA family ATPase [Pseudomonadota bacterium]MDY6091467.1 AAA family ATPase [Bdellovibrionota bacterium]